MMDRLKEKKREKDIEKDRLKEKERQRENVWEKRKWVKEKKNV